MIEVARHIKSALTGISGIKTVEIGIEPNLSPKDYPIIRIVPTVTKPDNVLANTEETPFDIYVGIADKTERDGLETVYEALEAYQNEIIKRLHLSNEATFFWRQTRQDEDRLANVKVIAIRVDAIG